MKKMFMLIFITVIIYHNWDEFNFNLNISDFDDLFDEDDEQEQAA